MSNSPSPFATHGAGKDQSLLLVLSAPSGTGKTTLAHRLVAGTPNSAYSISCTTRHPRGNEREGIDYHFLSEQQFRELLHDDKFAEWAEVYGNYYGTLRSGIEENLKNGALTLFDIDVHGGEQIKVRYPQAVTVFILPPSYDELARRLRSRGTDEENVIERRLLAAQSEIRRGRSYDYVIINDDLDRALNELKAIVTAERCRSHRYDVSHLGF
jgi:guanylate kinase